MNTQTTGTALKSTDDDEKGGSLLLSIFLYCVLFLGAIILPKVIVQQMFSKSITQQLEERVSQDMERQRGNTFVPDAPKNIRF
ncbi:hypothetical protein [Aeoliella sp. SH292]|uniref:hypothetical protein n=1 Tax=Aeoliella sp. SH292 TaxID=3454464 RepID=UPI003F956158